MRAPTSKDRYDQQSPLRRVPPRVWRPVDLEAGDARQLTRNVRAVAVALAGGYGASQLDLKIARWANKHGYSVEAVRAEIQHSEMFAATFAADPVKQNLKEKRVARVISTRMRDYVQGFETLDNRGEDAVHLLAHDVCVGAADSPVKSIDFTWVSGGYRAYALQKWTREAGGGQDHQYEEACRFLDIARGVTRTTPRPPRPLAGLKGDLELGLVGDDGLVPTLFFAICDGGYYSADRIADMAHRVAGYEHVCATGVNDLYAHLAAITHP